MLNCNGHIEYPYQITDAVMITVEFDDGKTSYIYCLEEDFQYVLEELQQYPCEIKKDNVSLKAMDESALMKICYPLAVDEVINNPHTIFHSKFTGTLRVGEES